MCGWRGEGRRKMRGNGERSWHVAEQVIHRSRSRVPQPLGVNIHRPMWRAAKCKGRGVMCEAHECRPGLLQSFTVLDAVLDWPTFSTSCLARVLPREAARRPAKHGKSGK